MENGDSERFYKNQMYFVFPMILVYSNEDILNYLSKKFNFCNIMDMPDIEDIADIKIPKITYEQNPEDNYQDGCFELAETFDVNLVKNNLMLSLNDNVEYLSVFVESIYNIYKEHNALDIFLSQNCKYFGWYLYPEIIPNNICFVKRFLYMYCREENPSEKSFYRIINDDLRTRDSRKIYPYINILALINKFIEDELLASFEGKV